MRIQFAHLFKIHNAIRILFTITFKTNIMATTFFNLSESDQEKYQLLLNGPNVKQRVIAAENIDIIPSADQFNTGLTDRSVIVRLAWAQRDDITPTQSQYSIGLADADYMIREAWAEREDMEPSDEQYASGLCDPSDWVRGAWAVREDMTPTIEQLVNCLNDVSLNVRRSWEKRKARLERHLGSTQEFIQKQIASALTNQNHELFDK